MSQAAGHLADNVMHFARVLRDAGLPVGTDRVQLALHALLAGALESRRDFKAALAACFVDRAEHRTLFDQAFELFWRDPDLLARLLTMLLPRVQAMQTNSAATKGPRENRRLADALFPHAPAPTAPSEPPRSIDIDARCSSSDRELLRQRDFESMSADEWRDARRLVARIASFNEPLPSRRTTRSLRPGQVDWRATLAAMARRGGDWAEPRWRRPRQQAAPLVVLADISGSMSHHSRMLLHFTHALAQSELRVASFVFGTRLTPITRTLRQRDPDIAVAEVARQVQDWSGGTRISASLHEFNQHWARRVLGGGRATVLLVTDGLEHGDAAALAFEAERLAKSCRRLVWLNPLLRYAGFEPRATGVRALLPKVDLFLPCHNVASLEQLASLLADRSNQAGLVVDRARLVARAGSRQTPPLHPTTHRVEWT